MILSVDNSSRQKVRSFSSSVVLVALILLFLVLGKEVIFPVRAMVWHVSALLWWLTVSAACLGQGAFWFKVLGGEKLLLPPGMVISVIMGLGLGAMSMEVLVLAALGLMNTPALTILVLLVLILSMLFGRKTVFAAVRDASRDASQRAKEAVLPLGMVLISAVISFPIVLVPTRAFDALSYHLEVPLRFLQAGGVVNIPENIYSYSPLLTQMLYGLGLGLVGVDLAGLFYYLFFILTIWTIWSGGEKLFGNLGAAWAAALLALTPVFLVEVPQTGADWSMTFFLLAALFLVTREPRDVKQMVMAGILAGMAAGCRHQALGYAIVLIPVAGLAADLFKRRTGVIRCWSVFVLSSMVSTAPWYLKNLVQTGDPLYPLLSSITGKLGHNVDFVDSFVGSRSTDLLWSWIMVPYQATFDPMGLSMTATIGILPIALVLLLPFVKQKQGGSAFLLLWVLLSFVAWHLTFRTFRYAMPMMAVGYLWLGALLAHIARGNGLRENVLKVVVSVSLIANAGVFLGLFDYTNKSVDAALGTRSPERYIMETYEIYPAINFLNQIEPPPGKVLFLGEMRGFYSHFSREVPSHNAPNRLLEMVKRGEYPEQMVQNLKSAGFTHILLNPAEWERMAHGNRNAPLWVLTAPEKKALYSMLGGQTKRVFTANGVSVHRIRNEQ